MSSPVRIGGDTLQRVFEVFTNSYGRFGARETLLGAAKLGLKHMELGLWSVPAPDVEPLPGAHPLSMIGERTTPEQLEEFKSLAKENGIRIISAFGHGDLRTDEGVEILRQQMDIAEELGVRFYTVSAPERSSTVYDNLLKLADYALARGMIICLETHPPLVPDAAGGLQTMRDLKHSNIRINFDTATLFYYNEDIDIVAELEGLVEYVVHVHLKDSRRKYQDWYFPALGEGNIDFPAIFRVFDQVGFRGPFSLELEGIAGEERTLELHHGRVKRSLEYLREIGVY